MYGGTPSAPAPAPRLAASLLDTPAAKTYRQSRQKQALACLKNYPDLRQFPPSPPPLPSKKERRTDVFGDNSLGSEVALFCAVHTAVTE